MKLFTKIRQYLRARRLHAVLDGRDNSVTLSKRLYKHIEHNLRQGKVFVFRAGDEYAFTLNIPDEPTQVSDIQYNGKYKTIGFESLCPTVNQILYDYCLPFGKHKLRVRYNAKFDYYIIQRA